MVHSFYLTLGNRIDTKILKYIENILGTNISESVLRDIWSISYLCDTEGRKTRLQLHYSS